MTAVIVQARMWSERLPGKIILPMGGRTLIDIVLAQAKKIFAETHIIATTENTAPFFKDLRGWHIVVGPEDNVLTRFIIALDAFKDVQTVVRVCADSPFLSPEVINLTLLQHKPSFDMTIPDRPMPGIATPVVRASALRMLAAKATPEDQKHVTVGITEERGFKVQRVPIKLSIDSLEDYELLRKVMPSHNVVV